MELTLENFQKVYEMLEDDLSKSIFLNRMNYLVSYDIKFIKNIIPPYLPRTDMEGKSPFIYDALSLIPANAQIVLYGAGGYPKKHIHQWKNDSRIIGFCSNNKQKQQTGYLGYPVMSPEQLILQGEYYVVVSALLPKPKTEILNFLTQAGYPQEKIFCLAEMIEDKDQYFPNDIINFTESEVFIDAGSYDLDTSLELKKRCPNLEKVYAFEPDPGNIKKCQMKKGQTGFFEAEIFPFGTWSHRDSLYFNAKGTEGARIVEEETADKIDVVAIDEFVPSPDKTHLKITFIKMDVEGAELESLKGAKETVQRDKPKLAICVYHKPEDLVTIPLYIKGLVPEYKIYMRHHTNFVGDTVLYAIP